MTIIIETPKGSHKKFKYDQRQEKFTVHKILPGSMVFPFDFGFVPQTRGDDGDPLDIVILSKSIHPTGTHLNSRIIGCLPAKQTDLKGTTIRNDRFVGVPDDAGDYSDIHSLEQVPEETISNIQSFFISYLSAENKQVVFLPILNNRQATQLLQLSKA